VAPPTTGNVLDGVLASQPAPSRDVVLGTLVLAAVGVLAPAAWRPLRHVVTIAHESGHAAVAALAGRRLHGVRLHRDTSGLTTSSGPRRGLGVVLTLLAGYLAPAAIGLAAAFALWHGRVVLVLWAAIVLLAALLLMIRNWFGVLLVLCTGLTLLAVLAWANAAVQGAAAYLLAWFLLVAAPRPVLELQAARSRGRGGSTDADQLAAATRVPGLVWVTLFLAGTSGALWLGARGLLAV
jgi:Peptidase M50B-like